MIERTDLVSLAKSRDDEETAPKGDGILHPLLYCLSTTFSAPVSPARLNTS
jgi:hypothetical protein